MAAHTPTTPVAGRRRLIAGLLAIAGGGILTSGMAAGVAAAIPEPAVESDAALLALRAELDAAVADAGHWNVAEDCPDDELNRSVARLSNACWAIIKQPVAQTAAGRALKAAASLHQLRFSYGNGHWPGIGEKMAWTVLREMAGAVYVPVAVPDYARGDVPDEEPELTKQVER